MRGTPFALDRPLVRRHGARGSRAQAREVRAPGAQSFGDRRVNRPHLATHVRAGECDARPLETTDPPTGIQSRRDVPVARTSPPSDPLPKPALA